MPIAATAIAITLGTSIAGAIANKTLDITADSVVNKAKKKLEEKFNLGEYAVIQRNLEGARDDVLARCQTPEQRKMVNNVLETLFQYKSGPLLDEFGAQATQIYLLPSADAPAPHALAKTYRKVSNPAAIVRGEILDENSLAKLFEQFFIAFRERLLREPDFTHLREYFQLTETRKIANLQYAMLDRLDAIAVNTAHPVEDFNHIRQTYLEYLTENLKDHTIRGFSPRVSGRDVSLPIAKIFLPLQAVEGRPALAEYAEKDLIQQAVSEVSNELSWQQRQNEIEKRFAQLSARQSVQRPLSLADLLQSSRAVLLGDPGTGKTTVTRYITYALATGDATHIGKRALGLTPVLIRLATYANTFEKDKNLHLTEYIEKEHTSRSEFGSFLRQEVEGNRCLVILDGLDEVADPGLRQEITERIQTMVASFSGNRFLVTSRIVGYEQSPLTREFQHATLKELSQEDKKHFIQLWYNAMHAELGEESQSEGAGDLIEALENKPQIARMAANPLLLTIMVLMHWRGTKLPSRRVQVYQNATDTLVEYWTKRRRVDMDAEDVKAILAPIAHYIISSNVSGVISESELLPRFFKGIAEQEGCDMREAKQVGRKLLRNLNEQSGLFLERGLDSNGQPVYGFLHQTFGEYLAALHMVEEIQSRNFTLDNYIHRSIWHEPLLLMAGHLAIYSKPQANTLLQGIMDANSLYEATLQRDLLLAADCLADDVQVRPKVSQQILLKLAKALEHDAPQVQKAALERYKRLNVTRHREAAIETLREVFVHYAEPDKLSAETGLKLATGFSHLKAFDYARPLVWHLGQRKYQPQINMRKIHQLRFEGWPDQAADYLFNLLIDKENHYSVYVGDVLADCGIGPIDGELALRILGEKGFQVLIERLIENENNDLEKARLRWLIILSSSASKEEHLKQLITAETKTPAIIRRLAAKALLNSDQHEKAVSTLLDLANNDPNQASIATRTLLEIGRTEYLNWQLLQDIALLADNSYVLSAINTLFRAGDIEIALPAALHVLVTASPKQNKSWSFVAALIKHGQTEIGLAAARWLALRPGSSDRLEACEALLEAEHLQEAIPLLKYLAYECYNTQGQGARQHLLRFREAEMIVPLLINSAYHASPNIRYQACYALSLINQPEPDDRAQSMQRSLLKQTILAERTQALRQAQDSFCQAGLRALENLTPSSERAEAARLLGQVSLTWLRGAFVLPSQITSLEAYHWPAIRWNIALFYLRTGKIDLALDILTNLLLQTDQPLSVPVKLKSLSTLGQFYGPNNAKLFFQTIREEDKSIRQATASALRNLGDTSAVPHLITALSDEDSSVRESAAEALGDLGDTSAVPHLITALTDEEDFVRGSAASALGNLGDTSVVPHLITVLNDEDSSVRASAAYALGNLGDTSAVPHLITALNDEDSSVRWCAAAALGNLDDTSAVPHLISALSDEDSSVRSSAASALRNLGDVTAVPHLITALSDEDSSVRGNAASALRNLGDTSAVPHLISALSDEDSSVRSSAADALRNLGDTTAVPHLISALSDEDSSVRRTAASALGNLGDTSAVPHLITALSDEDSFVRRFTAEALGIIGDNAAYRPLLTSLINEDQYEKIAFVSALGRLQASEAMPTLVAITSSGYEDFAQRQIGAVIHIAPAQTTSVLDRYEPLFYQQSWMDLLRGQALWQLGDAHGALKSFQQAIAKEEKDNSDNFLALAHFHLENDDLNSAEVFVHKALQEQPKWSLCLLSQAVVLWLMGEKTEALEKLNQARKRSRQGANTKNLAYEHFWRAKAIAALDEMLEQSS